MRAIPQVPKAGEPRDRFDSALKENMEIIAGVRKGKIEKLKASASLGDVISKINELIDRLQT